MKVTRMEFLAGIIIVIAAVLVWFSYSGNIFKISQKELPAPAFAVKEYSLSGKVTAIDGNIITLNVGRVFVGDIGNYVAYEDKKVTISDKTVISKVINLKGKIVIKPGTINDFTVGSKITVFSDSNIALKDSFTPTRLDISL